MLLFFLPMSMLELKLTLVSFTKIFKLFRFAFMLMPFPVSTVFLESVKFVKQIKYDTNKDFKT